MSTQNCIIRPVLTEKATSQANTGVYTFEVMPHAHKQQIKQTIESLFQVKVIAIRISVRPGKKRRVGRRMVVKQLKDRKFAYIKTDKTIDLFPRT